MLRSAGGAVRRRVRLCVSLRKGDSADIIVALIRLEAPMRGQPEIIGSLLKRAIVDHLRGETPLDILGHHFHEGGIHSWTDMVFYPGCVDANRSLRFCGLPGE